MKTKFNWITITVALAGAAVCVAAVAQFLTVISENRLGFTDEHHVREHYLAVGNSYAQGFVVGFFFCFSLALIAISIANLRAAALRRRRRALGVAADAATVDGPPRIGRRRSA